MKKQVELPRQIPGPEFERRAQQILAVLQVKLMPDHASEVVAINVDTGDYALGRTAREAQEAFRARWPSQLSYRVRVDGGPVVKFRGK